MRNMRVPLVAMAAALLLIVASFAFSTSVRAVVYSWDYIPGVGLVSNSPVVTYAPVTMNAPVTTNAAVAMNAGSTWRKYTVATLPTCSSSNAGEMLEVTDATTPSYDGALTGGGAVLVPVVCSGTAWLSH